MYFIRGNKDLVKYLIDHGANVNSDYECSELVNYTYDYAYKKTTYYKTLLSMECEEGDKSLVKYLIDHGVDVNIQCYKKEKSYFAGSFNKYYTPLMIAHEKGIESIVKYLIDHD
ncbi:ankyrin repeat-containing domain protein [Neocallimastix lanati (nom. inval.)]|uniref:Uncharacterized protein n=1 Tax=Neocallimastix californiae TaxID=1754190 RepID=A0A1Y2BZ33_9FUNG|nr:ankyrin repeat-containing domain protein [Neocallimastix sp. JGI-2020a]ORY40028.1 hypothetical protein LY90DRAFT_510481 [Neocallimastix californiae]|eukprot:ORY40028.1 hypothetical protein LY90DRAFT_510481 [Neocallimastix californiae]